MRATRQQCRDIVATAVMRSTVTVVAIARACKATTRWYRGNGGCRDKDKSKGNSSKNSERGGNNGGDNSLLSLFFLLRLEMVTWLFCLLDQHSSRD